MIGAVAGALALLVVVVLVATRDRHERITRPAYAPIRTPLVDPPGSAGSAATVAPIETRGSAGSGSDTAPVLGASPAPEPKLASERPAKVRKPGKPKPKVPDKPADKPEDPAISDEPWEHMHHDKPKGKP